MPIKFQYNKTALNTLQKQLKMRQKALPTLQNKESALRLEVRKAKDKSEKLLRDREEAERRYDYLAPLWNEFEPGLVSIVDIDLVTVKVAGVVNHSGATFPSLSISIIFAIVFRFGEMYSQTPENVFANEHFEGTSSFHRWFM